MNVPSRLALAVAVVAGTACPEVAADEKKLAIPVAPERIVIPMPAGWKVAYHAKDGRQEVREFVPEGETVEDWSAMVTTKIFEGLNRGAREYNLHTTERFAALCTEATKIVGQSEDRFGYVSSLAFIECLTSPETREKNKYVRKVEFMLQLAIKGRDALYVAESAWHTDDLTSARPTGDPELLKEITSRLDKVYVCDDRIEERKCDLMRTRTE